MKIQKFINTEKFRLVFYLTGFNPMSWTLVHLYPLFYYSKIFLLISYHFENSLNVCFG